MRVLDLFSGIGGFSLGLERAGMRTVAFCEIDPFCRRVLAKHWPDAPCYDDVRTLTGARLATDGITIDAICGGFPCQDISAAGKREGIGGARSGLWKHYFRLIGEIRPKFVFVENVADLLVLGMGTVLGDLASIGYDAIWRSIQAAELGAPHSRDRIWIVSYPSSAGLEGWRLSCRIQEEITNACRTDDAADAETIARVHSLGKSGVSAVIDAMPHGPRWAGQQWPKTRPCIRRVDDGIPDRVDRTSSLGNAVVPLAPEIIGRAIMTTARADELRGGG
jgi:DNA (cytosine-5)-methyltransferase 1